MNQRISLFPLFRFLSAPVFLALSTPVFAQELTVNTPFAERGTVTCVDHVLKAVANEGYEFDYWSDGQQTFAEAEIVYEGSATSLIAFFKPVRDLSAPLPPTMGWSSWNTYHADISDALICSQADALEATGLYEKGYRYVNIDDGFQNNRAKDGTLQINPTRFPNGIQSVVDYVHSKGMKAGIYSDAGYNTCASIWSGETGGTGTGFYTHDQQDADFFFSRHRFDFVKVDFCGGYASSANSTVLDPQKRYTDIRTAIDKTGRDVQYNLCRWAFPGTWAGEVGDSWRTTGDIWSSWSSDEGANYSVKSIIKENLYLSAYCTPGHYNDMDMLEVGVDRDGHKLTTQECKTHFGMWCILTSPLLIGCDVNSISKTHLEILGNEELIAVNQDPCMQQAYVVSKSNTSYVLVKDLLEPNGLTRAVALYNSADVSKTLKMKFSDLDLAGTCTLRNLTDHKDLGEYTEVYSTTVPAHGAIIYKVTGESRTTRTLYEAETGFCTAYNELAEEVGALYTENTKFSGGVAMTALGGTKTDAYGKTISNDILWKNVYVPEDCTVTLEIDYACRKDRTMTLSVNDEEIETFACNSGGDSKVSTVTVTASLKVGNNVVRLYNDASEMPIVDCFRITGLTDGIAAIETTTPPAGKTYNIAGQPLTAPQPGVNIISRKKVLVK